MNNAYILVIERGIKKTDITTITNGLATLSGMAGLDSIKGTRRRMIVAKE